MEDVEKHAFPMKTITDSIKLRNSIIRNFENALLVDDREVMNSLIDFVVVGGGPTGVELAGALAELKLHVFPNDYKELDIKDMDIHLIEASGRLLNGMSDPASRKAKEYLENLGVHVHLNTAVKSYDGTTVTLSNENTLQSRMMIWAAGVTAQPIGGIPAEAFGRGRRIKVDAFNRVPGYDNIFAVGDACIMDGDGNFQNGHPQMAQPAMQQGKLVAVNIQNILQNKPLKPFRYFDKGSMATIGRNKAVADLKAVKVQGLFAWLIWMFIHLVSLIGFKNKFFVFLSWIFSYFSYDKSNRLIIARPKDGVN
jgi:NADH dehydrogenase